MKNHYIAILLLATALTACNPASDTTVTDTNNPTDLFTKVYTTANIEMQTFTIDADKSTTLEGKSGTMILIPRNSLLDSLGNPVTGKVEIQLQEALKPADWVLANLTTVYQGQALESGGMIYLNARAGNHNLSIRKGQSLTVILPTDSAFAGMSMFEGRKDSTAIVWENPVGIPMQAIPAAEGGGDLMESSRASTNASVLTRHVEGKDTILYHSQEILDKAYDIVIADDGLKITKDSFLMIDGERVQLFKRDTFSEWTNWKPKPGTNTYHEDLQTTYIFTLKKLGWANIDRLQDNPRTQAVELVTAISNQAHFPTIYVTMITKNMHLPGYQKKDSTYGFSHGDYEEQRLPIGESATIIATAYKNGKTYYALQKITISKKTNVNLQLAETTTEQLKAELLRQI